MIAEYAWRRFPDTFAEKLGLQSPGGPFRSTRLTRFIGKIVANAVREKGARIIVNVHPGSGKSEGLDFACPTWHLEHFARNRVLLATNTADLATTFGRRVRDEFTGNPKLTTRLKEDSQAADRWNTQEGGGLKCVGAGAGIMGFRANLLICDDPYGGWVEAQSAAERNRINSWFTGTFLSRMEPGASVVLVMQRMNRNDLTGYLLQTGVEGPWTVISLPAFAGVNDPMGRTPGEIVCPERWPVAEIESKRRTMLKEQWSAMYDQNPQADPEGRVYGRFTQANLKTVSLSPALPIFFGCDFNLNPGVSIEVGQSDLSRDIIGVRHEVWGDRRRTGDAIRLAISRLTDPYGGKFVFPHVDVYGDRSSRTGNTASDTDVTDYKKIAEVLTEKGIKFFMHIPHANPGVKGRAAATNDALCDDRNEIHLFIDPRCRESDSMCAIVEDFENLQIGEDGKPDKGDKLLSHASDALGYAIQRIRPVGGAPVHTGGQWLTLPPRPAYR